MKKTALIAIGGNSLIRTGQRGTIAEQIENARLTARSVAEVAARGYKLVVTHGNGPQVGSQLLRSEAGSGQTYQLPLDVCVASTQGEIGFVLQNALQAALDALGVHRPVVTLVTQVVVDPADPAFRNPTKPIGPFYSRSDAERKRSELGWNIIEDAARGYRRVVPSPLPIDIVELDIVRHCLKNDIIVVAVGGGGIPVVRKNGGFTGIEAVIDKDRASALLAGKLGLEEFIISTDVEHVCLNYRKPDQEILKEIPSAYLRDHLTHFQEGSMKPKIEAALQFLDAGGKRVIITNPENLLNAIDGKTGTIITHRDSDHEPSSYHRIPTVQPADPR